METLLEKPICFPIYSPIDVAIYKLALFNIKFSVYFT